MVIFFDHIRIWTVIFHVQGPIFTYDDPDRFSVFCYSRKDYSNFGPCISRKHTNISWSWVCRKIRKQWSLYENLFVPTITFVYVERTLEIVCIYCSFIVFPERRQIIVAMRWVGFSSQQVVDLILCIVTRIMIVRRNIPILLTDRSCSHASESSGVYEWLLLCHIL